MNDEAKEQVQLILGLLGYTDKASVDAPLQETLRFAYEDIVLLKEQAMIGQTFLIAVEAVENYRERHL